MYQLDFERKENYSIVRITIDEILEPQDIKYLPDMMFDLPMNKGIIISGRAPIWLYSALVHYFHPHTWVAVHDPRLGGAVVVSTHTKDKSLGDVVKFE